MDVGVSRTMWGLSELAPEVKKAIQKTTKNFEEYGNLGLLPMGPDAPLHRSRSRSHAHMRIIETLPLRRFTIPRERPLYIYNT